MTKKTNPPFPREVRERAVCLVLEHQGEHATQWAAICLVAGKIGCLGETLRNCVRQTERDRGLDELVALVRHAPVQRLRQLRRGLGTRVPWSC